MRDDVHRKVTVSHLRRDAYLYVRQSTLRQVFENTESTQRQYGLRERAVALGWPSDRVMVIDSDLGQSGASGVDREGFQKLVGEVGLGRAGIVLGLEVSRLARNSTDWHRLLEICALTDTLILDEDGLYNPGDFNDRLLLGLKGTMSEAELHVLRSRLRGGILNQARRGALRMLLPVGLVYDPAGKIVLDPDGQVRESMTHLFESFARTGSASATVRHFREQGLRFPRRPSTGPHRGELLWEWLDHGQVLRVLHNPSYAGAFSFGRTRKLRGPGGSVKITRLPREEWTVLLQEAHAGYISWERFELNLRLLQENAQAHGAERRRSPAREGPALLQGLAVCGLCGRRMTVRYRVREGRLWPEYVCQRESIETAKAKCQTIPGASLDRIIGELLIETVTPMVLEVALQVQAELEARAEEVDTLRRQRVERVRHEVDLARRRFMGADPANRLVVDVLEAEWNDKLRALRDVEEENKLSRSREHPGLGEEQRKRILALATDFPRLWNDPRTPQRERKRMIRLLLEDVTLSKGNPISVGVRFRGGATRTLTVPPARPAWQLCQTPAQIVAEVDALLEDHTEGEIADILNRRGRASGKGKPFRPHMVHRIRRAYGLKTRYARLRDAGLLTLTEIASMLGVSMSTVKTWRDQGLLRAQVHNDKNECLYEQPGDNPPAKAPGRKLSNRRRFHEIAPNRTEEVQCEA